MQPTIAHREHSATGPHRREVLIWEIAALGLALLGLSTLGRAVGLSGAELSRWLTDIAAPTPLVFVGLFAVFNTPHPSP